MKKGSLESACKIRVGALDLGIISLGPRSKTESHDTELVHQGNNPEGKTFRSTWLHLGECG